MQLFKHITFLLIVFYRYFLSITNDSHHLTLDIFHAFTKLHIYIFIPLILRFEEVASQNVDPEGKLI